MGEGRAVQLMGGTHPIRAEGRLCILHQPDVISKLRRKAAGAFETGIGQEAEPDPSHDLPLLDLEFKIGVPESA